MRSLLSVLVAVIAIVAVPRFAVAQPCNCECAQLTPTPQWDPNGNYDIFSDYQPGCNRTDPVTGKTIYCYRGGFCADDDGCTNLYFTITACSEQITNATFRIVNADPNCLQNKVTAFDNSVAPARNLGQFDPAAINAIEFPLDEPIEPCQSKVIKLRVCELVKPKDGCRLGKVYTFRLETRKANGEICYQDIEISTDCPLGIGHQNEVLADELSVVIPNPSSNELRLKTSRVIDKAVIRLLTTDGRELLHKQYTSHSSSAFEAIVDVSQVPVGAYVIVLESQGILLRKNVMIQR